MTGLLDPATEAQKHVAERVIKVAGAEIDPTVYPIHEIRVQDYLHLPDVCTFTVGFKPQPPPNEPIKVEHYIQEMEKSPFTIGAELEIQLTAAGELQGKQVFLGDIVTLEPAFEAGSASLSVRAYDRAHKLMRERKARTFQSQTTSDIVSSIVSDAGLNPKVTSTSVVHDFMHQNNELDLDFILRLAQRIGYEFLVEGSDAILRKAEAGDKKTLAWPEKLHSFIPRMTAVQQVESVEVRSWDPASKSNIAGTASSPNQIAETGKKRDSIAQTFGGKLVVATEPVADTDSANQLAQALLDRVANAYVQADGECEGDPTIRSGATIEVTGVGEHWSGTYRVQSSTHLLLGGGTYTTQFSSTAVQTITGALAVSRPADFADQIVVGIVTNNQDPDNMGRVRVKFPMLGDDVESGWARVVVPSAGDQRGMMMLPIQDEEVLVAFECGDTTRPYVIGSLFNGTQKPGEKLAAQDGSFGLRSDKKMDVYSKEEVTFQADKTYQITVQGDVTQTFKAAFSCDVSGDTTIKVQSGNVTIKAQQGNITIATDIGDININAGGNLSLSGRMVSASADSTMSLSANASASLKGNAGTMIG